MRIENGSITNQNTGEINNEGNLYLDLDFTQNTGATYTGGSSSWLWFEGASNQSINSDAAINITQLRVHNSNRLVLGNQVNISSSVDLNSNGNIELGTNNLVLGAGATITNYDASNYIITNNSGTLQQEVAASNVVFPIGNSSYNPATINNTGTTDNFLIRVEDQVWTNGISGSLETQDIVNRSWHITEETAGGSVSALTVQWDVAQELTSFDRSQSGVAHWTGSVWDHPSTYSIATTVGSSFSQTRTGISSFSPFTVEDSKESLPIELLFFEAHHLDKNNVHLDWATETEINNQGFEVQRMLDTETEFKKVAWVEGFGTTTNLINYELNDLNPHQGITYYRLKQIDFDGTFSYSPVRAVEGYQTGNGSMQVYPIPTRNSLNVDFSNWSEVNTDITIKITDVYGHTLITKNATIQQNTIISINEVQNLLPGTYFLVTNSAAGLDFVRKFTKEK